MQAGIEKVDHGYLQPGKQKCAKCAEIRGSLSAYLKGHYNYGAEYFIYF